MSITPSIEHHQTDLLAWSQERPVDGPGLAFWTEQKRIFDENMKAIRTDPQRVCASLRPQDPSSAQNRISLTHSLNMFASSHEEWHTIFASGLTGVFMDIALEPESWIVITSPSQNPEANASALVSVILSVVTTFHS